MPALGRERTAHGRFTTDRTLGSFLEIAISALYGHQKGVAVWELAIRGCHVDVVTV